MTRLRRILPLAVLVCLLAPLTAQNFQGIVRGSVRDPQGAIAAASVELIEESTGLSRTASSNEVGDYAFTNVVPGIYTVRASAPGYKTFERTGLRIATQMYAAVDVVLDVGSITETMRARSGQSRLIWRISARLVASGRSVMSSMLLKPSTRRSLPWMAP